MFRSFFYLHLLRNVVYLRMALTAKEQKFCDEYLVDLNQTQAAIRSGYSVKTASSIASQLLTKLNIQEYITTKRKELSTNTGITQERILAEYAKLAFFDIRTIYDENNALKDIADLSDAAGSAIAGIEVLEEFSGFGDEREHIGNTVKVKFIEKTKALDSLARHLGMFAKDNAQSQPVVNIPPMTDNQVDAIINAVRSPKA